MTEAEWMASSDPARMLEHLRREGYAAGLMGRRHGPGAISDRKLRLWVDACRQGCSRLRSASYAWPEIPPEGLRLVIEAWASPANYTDIPPALRAALLRDIAGNPFAKPVVLPPGPPCRKCNGSGKGPLGAGGAVQSREPPACKACSGTGRQPCPWLTPQVMSLATAAYDERPSSDGTLDPLTLAALADALEEAGCTEQATDDCKTCGGLGWMGRISLSGREEPTWPCPACKGVLLAHLRSPEPHYRGCWALDLILGKS